MIRSAVVTIGKTKTPLSFRAGKYWGLCPFHSESIPSFYVKPNGKWYCFGCAEGGLWDELVETRRAQ